MRPSGNSLHVAQTWHFNGATTTDVCHLVTSNGHPGPSFLFCERRLLCERPNPRLEKGRQRSWAGAFREAGRSGQANGKEALVNLPCTGPDKRKEASRMTIAPKHAIRHQTVSASGVGVGAGIAIKIVVAPAKEKEREKSFGPA